MHVGRYGSGLKGMNGGARKDVKPAGVSKFDYGKMMAACLAYLILNQRDATSVALFDTAVKHYIPRSGNLASIHNNEI